MKKLILSSVMLLFVAVNSQAVEWKLLLQNRASTPVNFTVNHQLEDVGVLVNSYGYLEVGRDVTVWLDDTNAFVTVGTVGNFVSECSALWGGNSDSGLWTAECIIGDSTEGGVATHYTYFHSEEQISNERMQKHAEHFTTGASIALVAGVLGMGIKRVRKIGETSTEL